MKIKTTITPKAKTVLAACLGMVAILYFAGMAVFQKDIDSKRIPDKDIVRFTGLPADTTVQGLLEIGGSAYDLATDDETLILSPDIMERFSVPYRLSAKVEGQNGKARDIVLSLDARGVLYTVLLDGFSSEDKVSLSYKGSRPIASMPFDWSGRTVLEVLVNPDWDSEVCVEIESQEPFGFCQLLIGKSGRA